MILSDFSLFLCWIHNTQNMHIKNTAKLVNSLFRLIFVCSFRMMSIDLEISRSSNQATHPHPRSSSESPPCHLARMRSSPCAASWSNSKFPPENIGRKTPLKRKVYVYCSIPSPSIFRCKLDVSFREGIPSHEHLFYLMIFSKR